MADTVVGRAAAVTALVATGVTLDQLGIGYDEQARLLAAVVGTILLPGLVIGRRFHTDSLPARLGVGFVFGLGPQLAGLAASQRLHLPWLVWALPLGIAAVVAAVDLQARRGGGAHTPRPARPRLPWWASLGLLGVWALILRLGAYGPWSATDPSGARPWYQDLYWQLSLSAEARHRMPPLDPQSAAEGTLSYHWFSNAHTAALSAASGVGLVPLTAIAWVIPTAAAIVALTFGLAHYLARTPAAGLLGTALVVLPPSLVAVSALDPGFAGTLVWYSQSHMFSLPLEILLTWCVINLLRARPLRALDVVLTLYLALLCPGAKVSLLPTVLGGIGLVGLAALRRREGILRPLLAGAVGSVIVLVTRPLFGGGGGGSELKWGATVDQLPVWLEQTDLSGDPGPLVLNLAIAALVGSALAALVVVAAARDDRERTPDPAPLLYLGMMIAALVAVFALRHPSLSQLYFMRGLAPVTAAFIGWGTVAAWRRVAGQLSARRATLITLLAFAVGLAVGLWWTATSAFAETRHLDPGWLIPYEVGLALVAVAMVATLRSRRGTMAAVGLALAALVLGSAVARPVRSPLLDVVLGRQAVADLPSGQELTSDELDGARALAKANPDGELVATNVHCRNIARSQFCDNRGFWVSAFSESPVYIGGWGYSASGRAATDASGDSHSYITQPFHDQSALQLNDGVFARPTPDNLAELRRRGVRFLYGDSRATPVSPDLSGYAEPVFISPTVQVYRLP